MKKIKKLKYFFVGEAVCNILQACIMKKIQKSSREAYNNNILMQQSPPGEQPDTSTTVNDHQIIISKTKTSRKIRLKVNTELQKLKTETRWNLSSNRLTVEEIYQILGKVKDMQNVVNNVDALYLHWNQAPKLIKFSQKCQFPNLKILNLGGNLIESVQPLLHGNFDQLQQLWLWFNNLVRIDTLRKCNFPSLKRLDLGDNKIVECRKLGEMYCPSLHLVNIEKNCLSQIQSFAKLIINSDNLLLQFTCNDIIKAFDQPRKKGNKKINQLAVDQRNGQFKLKYF